MAEVNVSAPALHVSGAEARCREDADRAAFEAFYGVAFPKVYGFVRCQGTSVEAAQEIVSLAFLKAYSNWHRAPRGDGDMAWVFRIAHNTLIDYWRVDRRHEEAAVPIDQLGPLRAAADSPERAYERKQQAANVLKFLGGLPPDDRVVLALKFAGQRNNREIAAILGLSEGAVSMRLLRALRRMRERMTGADEA